MRDGLPDFLVIGALKAGTTSLFEYLRGHPQLFLPDAKELGFFVAEHQWSHGLDWYRAQFAAAPGGARCGEVSPAYAWYPSFGGVPERIASVVPDVRIVYLVRDPFERMRSQWHQGIALGKERRTLTRAVLETPDYVDCSRYATQLERYLRVFPREQVHVVVSERLRDARGETLRGVLGFLGVDDAWLPQSLDRAYHRTAEKGIDAPATLAPLGENRLRAPFAAEAARLRPYLPADFDGWALAA